MNNTNTKSQAGLIKVVCEVSERLTVTRAALITKAVNFSASVVTLTSKNMVASAENVFEILSLGMVAGDIVVLSLSGEDAEETCRIISALLTENISSPISPDVFSRSAA